MEHIKIFINCIKTPTWFMGSIRNTYPGFCFPETEKYDKENISIDSKLHIVTQHLEHGNWTSLKMYMEQLYHIFLDKIPGNLRKQLYEAYCALNLVLDLKAADMTKHYENGYGRKYAV